MAVMNLLANTSYFNDAEFIVYVVLSAALIIIMFIMALAAILLVLFQQSNSEGIQSITGSSETFFGKHKGKSIESRLKMWSWICLAILGVLAIAFYIVQVMAP